MPTITATPHRPRRRQKKNRRLHVSALLGALGPSASADLALFRYVAEPSDGLTLDGTLYYGLGRAEIDGFGITPGGYPGRMDDPAAYGRAKTWVAQQSARVGIALGWESGLQPGFQRLHPRVRVNGVTAESDSRFLLLRWRNAHGPSGGTAPLDAWRFAWGSDVRREKEQAQGPGSRFGGHRTQAAGFADLEANRGPWSGMAGMRLDRYDAHGTRLVYDLSLGFQASPRLSLRATGSLPLVFSAGAVYRNGYDNDTGGVLPLGGAWWVTRRLLTRWRLRAESYSERRKSEQQRSHPGRFQLRQTRHGDLRRPETGLPVIHR